MDREKVLIDKRGKILSYLLKFSLLLFIATVFPLFFSQQITGPIVNAVLLLSTVFLGWQGALLVGTVPSLVSLSSGLLPIFMAPMVPFIIVGNSILILVFSVLRKKGFWLGMVPAGFLKFLFLNLSGVMAANLFVKAEFGQKLVQMFGFFQLATALAGGVIAFLFLKTLRQNNF